MLGNLISGAGILFFLAGAGYWIRYLGLENRFRAIRRRTPWDFLGNFTILGMLTIALGRAFKAIGW